MNKDVIVVEKITIEAAIFELDKALDKTCDITDMLLHRYGIELTEDEFSQVFDIINS